MVGPPARTRTVPVALRARSPSVARTVSSSGPSGTACPARRLMRTVSPDVGAGATSATTPSGSPATRTSIGPRWPAPPVDGHVQHRHPAASQLVGAGPTVIDEVRQRSQSRHVQQRVRPSVGSVSMFQSFGRSRQQGRLDLPRVAPGWAAAISAAAPATWGVAMEVPVDQPYARGGGWTGCTCRVRSRSTSGPIVAEVPERVVHVRGVPGTDVLLPALPAWATIEVGERGHRDRPRRRPRAAAVSWRPTGFRRPPRPRCRPPPARRLAPCTRSPERRPQSRSSWPASHCPMLRLTTSTRGREARPGRACPAHGPGHTAAATGTHCHRHRRS